MTLQTQIQPPISAFRLSDAESIPFIYVVTYPRSGTTWVIQSLKLIFDAQDGEIDSKWFNQYKLPLMSDSYIGFRNAIVHEQPAIVKTHLPYKSYVSKCVQSRTIYVVRDGRDALTSYYFWKQTRVWNRSRNEVGFDAEEFARELNIEAAKWRDHVTGWIGSPNVFFTAYESLKHDYIKETRCIAEYAGLPLRRSVEEAKVRFVDELKPDGDIYRKGIVGDWQNYWDERHKDIFKSIANDAMIMLGYVRDDRW